MQSSLGRGEVEIKHFVDRMYGSYSPPCSPDRMAGGKDNRACIGRVWLTRRRVCGWCLINSVLSHKGAGQASTPASTASALGSIGPSASRYDRIAYARSAAPLLYTTPRLRILGICAPGNGSRCATMLSKNSSILLSSCANLGPLYHSHASNLHPNARPRSCRHTFSHSHLTRHGRHYAHHADPPTHRGDAELLSWPEATKPHQTPTPYQILHCSRGEAYSKNRFYALVKLYHPDRCHPTSAVAQLPLQVRLERYRLLVAAHDILSDVEKRKAYDAWGLGWAGHQTAGSAHHHYSWDFDERRWASDPRNNATWEDWERWHHENDGTKEADARTIQLSNFAFVSLILAFVSIGGVVQGTRFTTFNNSVAERREQIHREATMELRRSKDASASGDRDERIRSFLEHRESNMMGEFTYQRLPPTTENGGPDTVRKQ